MNTDRSPIPWLLALVLALTVAAPAAAAPPEQARANGNTGDSYPVDGTFTDHWAYESAANIQLDESNTLPVWSDAPTEVITDEVWIWDTWPLTDLSTRTASVEGWKIAFSLTADRDLPFTERHWTAEIGYSISRDGKSWQYQGDLFPEDVNPPGLREWAGSAVLVGDRVYAYYTASGDESSPVDGYFRQKLAVASARVVAGSDGVEFTDWSDHTVIAEADGVMYQTLEQSQAGPIIYAFRDPWVFRNPQDGDIYMLFEGNTAGETVECERIDGGTGDPGDYSGSSTATEAKYYNGNIGLARSTGSMQDFELLAPIMEANCVNQQLERPHVTFRGQDVYLWTITHKFTFVPSLQDIGPDGLIGWVGASIRSDYEPLNGTGLALANPPENNTQAYSWYVFPGMFVESFIDNVQGEYLGTLAPTVKLSVDGQNRTKIANIFDSPFIP